MQWNINTKRGKTLTFPNKGKEQIEVNLQSFQRHAGSIIPRLNQANLSYKQNASLVLVTVETKHVYTLIRNNLWKNKHIVIARKLYEMFTNCPPPTDKLKEKMKINKQPIPRKKRKIQINRYLQIWLKMYDIYLHADHHTWWFSSCHKSLHHFKILTKKQFLSSWEVYIPNGWKEALKPILCVLTPISSLSSIFLVW